MATSVNLTLQPARSSVAAGAAASETAPSGQEGAFAVLLAGQGPVVPPETAPPPAIAAGQDRPEPAIADEGRLAADPLGREVALALGTQVSQGAQSAPVVPLPADRTTAAAVARPPGGTVAGEQGRRLSSLEYVALSRGAQASVTPLPGQGPVPPVVAPQQPAKSPAAVTAVVADGAGSAPSAPVVSATVVPVAGMSGSEMTDRPGAPVTGAPVAGAPVVGAPVVSVSVTDVSVASAPVASAPVASAPVASTPVASAPVAGETANAGDSPNPVPNTGMPAGGESLAPSTGLNRPDAHSQAGEPSRVLPEGQVMASVPAPSAPGTAPAPTPAVNGPVTATAGPATGGFQELSLQLQGRQAAVARQLRSATPAAAAAPAAPGTNGISSSAIGQDQPPGPVDQLLNPGAPPTVALSAGMTRPFPEGGINPPADPAAVQAGEEGIVPVTDRPLPAAAGESPALPQPEAGRPVTETLQPVRSGFVEPLIQGDTPDGPVRIEPPVTANLQPGSTATGPTAPAVASPLQQSLTPGRPDFGQTLGQQLVWMVNQDRQRAEISVNPRHLGPVEVSLAMEHGKAHIQFFAHDAGVRDALEQAMPRLRELFDGNGLQLGQASVADQSQRQQQGDQARQGRAFAGGGNGNGGEGAEGEGDDAQSSGTWSSSAGDRMVDHYV